MAVKTFMAATPPTGLFTLLVDGVDQTAAQVQGSWTVAKNASGTSAEMVNGSAATGFTSQTTFPKPNGLVSGGGGNWNAFRTPAALTGTFAATSWTFTFAMRAGVASSQAGRMRLRVFKSVNSDGSSLTELTGSTQVGTTTAALTTTADSNSVVTWSPGTTFTLNNEYLYFAVAWEITTASGSNSGSVNFRTGQASSGTRFVTPDLATGNTYTKAGFGKEHG